MPVNLRKDNPNMTIWPKCPETEDEAVEYLKETPSLYGSFCRLNAEWRQRFLDYCQGKKT